MKIIVEKDSCAVYLYDKCAIWSPRLRCAILQKHPLNGDAAILITDGTDPRKCALGDGAGGCALGQEAVGLAMSQL